MAGAAGFFVKEHTRNFFMFAQPINYKNLTMKFILFLLLITVNSYSQINFSFIRAQEYNKEKAQFLAKKFISNEILDIKNNTVKFELDPLTAAQTGDLITLYYNCLEQKKEGLLFCFFGEYWDQNGTEYQGYAFKNLDTVKALELLTLIQNSMDKNEKFLKDDSNNNIVFKYDDLEIIISYSSQTLHQIRVFWNGFDSTWDATAFSRTKRRFNFKLAN